MVSAQESIGEIDVMLLKKRTPTGLARSKWIRRLVGLPEATYERRGGIQTIALYSGFCVPIGRDRGSLDAAISAELCPSYRRWFLIIQAGDVSRCHALATSDPSGGCYRLSDLGSTNGTYLCMPLDRAKRGSCGVVGLDQGDRKGKPLYLDRGSRLKVDAPVDWFSGQYCFLGESALIRLRLFGVPQTLSRPKSEADMGTMIVDLGGSVSSQIIHK